MKKVKIVYIISDINYALAFKWLARELDKEKTEPVFIFIGNNKPDLITDHSSYHIQTYYFRSSGKLSYLKILFQLIGLLKKLRPQIVHTHLFIASLIGLTAALLANVKIRIHTRHHSTNNIRYFPKLVKYDKLINKLSTTIIAVSDLVKKTMVEQEDVDPGKIKVIHHGLDMDLVSAVNRIQSEEIRDKYSIPRTFPVIGAISRFIHLKGVQDIVKSFEIVLTRYPGAHLVLANATGNYSEEIKKQLARFPSETYTLIPFEKELFSLYRLFDVFAHVPITSDVEAFGQTYIEAMAVGIPSIFTRSGIGLEILEHKKNCWIVDYSDPKNIAAGIESLIDNSELRNSIIQGGKETVRYFTIQKKIRELENVYYNLICPQNA